MTFHDLNLQLPAAAGRVEAAGYGAVGLASECTPATLAPAPAPPSALPRGKGQQPVAGLARHHRLTVTLKGKGAGDRLDQRKAALLTYGLVAAAPVDQPAFEAVCDGTITADLIALDLGEKLHFHLREAAVAAALANGIFFEVSYAVALRDQPARRQLIGNVQQLLRATRGRGLVLSSGAARAAEIRSPVTPST